MNLPNRSPAAEPAHAPRDLRDSLSRFAWLCPLLAVVLAVGALAVFGLSWRNAALAALLLVCPAVILWGVLVARRPAMIRLILLESAMIEHHDRRPAPLLRCRSAVAGRGRRGRRQLAHDRDVLCGAEPCA
jgi:hypothetical protein